MWSCLHTNQSPPDPMIRNTIIAGLLAGIVAIPFVMRPEGAGQDRPDRTLVIISPHNEAIRHEFANAFAAYWQREHGETVSIDWRTPGGTSEIAKFLASEFRAAFENYWRRELGRPWSAEVAGAFDNRSVELPDDPSRDSLAQAARRAFLTSDIGPGIDLFFGGGAYDFIQQARAGRLVDCGILQARPEWFRETSGIPQSLGGEDYYDPEGRWIGACLSSFGIVYNIDALHRLGIDQPPRQWEDLADPRLFGQVALADPTKSGSVAKAFEMLIQQQMQAEVKRRGGLEALDPEALDAALSSGWERGMRLILRIAANARYFTDSATKIPIDVSLGDAAAGMSIDFYGRFQSETTLRDSGRARMSYFTPHGGSSVGVDPIGMLRGARDPELARGFIEFVLSLDGQKLWNFQVGSPGGPHTYALRRLPIRRELYAPEWKQFRSDPDVNAYVEAEDFTYHPEWTAPLFSVIRFVVRTMCLDPHDELRDAWRNVLEAGMPPDAVSRLFDVSAVDYLTCRESLLPTLRSSDRVEEVRLAKELGSHFRHQFQATHMYPAGAP